MIIAHPNIPQRNLFQTDPSNCVSRSLGRFEKVKDPKAWTSSRTPLGEATERKCRMVCATFQPAIDGEGNA
jgi:hypothetical protein